jgi:hypothetical protein
MSAIEDIAAELVRARGKHPDSFHSPHEGFAVLAEEVDDLWDEVKLQTDERSFAKMRKEAVQIGAMALRFIEDVCDSRRGK